MKILLQSLGGKNKMRIKYQCEWNEDEDVLCLPKKMFPWTNDFSDLVCNGIGCTRVHHKDHEYYVSKQTEIPFLNKNSPAFPSNDLGELS